MACQGLVDQGLPFSSTTNVERETLYETIRKPGTYEMGMQIPCSVDTEVSTQDALRSQETRGRRDDKEMVTDKGNRNIGGPRDEGPYPFVPVDSAEV